MLHVNFNYFCYKKKFLILFIPFCNEQHEEMSCKITKSIFDKYNIELSDDGNENAIAADLVAALINGNRELLLKYLGPHHMFLSEVSDSNNYNIDAKKSQNLFLI